MFPDGGAGKGVTICGGGSGEITCGAGSGATVPG
jgi:hypothetical protein